MAEFKSSPTVLITTSGTGNRLGNLTQYTNKSLIRLGKKPAISYIIEHYADDTEFVVTTGYYGDHVEQFLKLVYPKKNIKFCPVDKYDGKGSSLLYSMYCAKDLLQKPFVFHACDSIIFRAHPENLTGNICLSAHTEHAEHYRTHKVNKDSLFTILEKGAIDSDLAHIGIIKIDDYQDFWKETENLLENFVDDSSLSDCHVINAMLRKGIKFKSLTGGQWLDVGNVQSLRRSRKEVHDSFEILDKDDESIFIFDEAVVVKFFHDKKTISNRLERVKYLKGFGPTILGHTDNFYMYEYIKGKEASKFVERHVFEGLLNTMFKEYWTQINESYIFFDKTREFYYDKTEKRVRQFLKNNNLRDENTIINGSYVPKFLELLKRIPIELVCSKKKYHFHGDFVLDNVIMRDGEVKFIDWRQDFCGELDGGDIYYDLAKLSHSLTINHALIANKSFALIDYDNQRINCVDVDVLRKASHVEFEKMLEKAIVDNGFDLTKVNVIKALIWINMAPLHEAEFGKFLYYFGLYNLNKYLNEL